MIASMSRNADSWDNAPTESFFNSSKNERVHGTRHATRAIAEADLLDDIEPFYNRKRRHSPLGYTSPAKFLTEWIPLSMSSKWRHNADALEAEKQRDAQSRGP